MSHILYEGPSQLDGSTDIIVIATGVDNPSDNQKTGAMIQTWILLKNTHPVEALRQNLDAPICGNCIHRSLRSCYVNVGRAPAQIWEAYKTGAYKYATFPWKHKNEIRIGAYGDPVAAPLSMWKTLLKTARGATGYTHQWRICNPGFKEFCMASVESPDERDEAKAMGWRTYRVRTPNEPTQPGEVNCPSDKGVKCIQCLGCGGTKAANTIDFSIPVHGLQWKVARFKTSKTLSTP